MRLFALLSALLVVDVCVAAAPTTRTFEFTYGAKIDGLKPGQTTRIWLPVPPSNADQKITLLHQTVPTDASEATEPEYGNRILFFAATADAQGSVDFAQTYLVERKEVSAASDGSVDDKAALERWLRADVYVPITGKSLGLLRGKKLPADPTDSARVLYDIVNSHMRYSKEGTGWGRGDSEWACDNGYGNCTDFHSLFITLARSRQIPAKFEIGFSLPEEPGTGAIAGYHCWAKFKPEGKSWVPVDISEANKNPKMREYYFGHLSPNRVCLSTGRDITLVPKQSAPPLNFFVYPHVEANGKAIPAGQIHGKFAYKDVAK